MELPLYLATSRVKCFLRKHVIQAYTLSCEWFRKLSLAAKNCSRHVVQIMNKIIYLHYVIYAVWTEAYFLFTLYD
jgi:hypothetical protein